MLNSKSVITSLAQHFKLSSSDLAKIKEEKIDMVRVLYVSAVDSIMYLMIYT